MRVINFLFSALLIIILVFVVGFLIFRETMLLVASSQIKGALKALRQIERNPTDYYYKCREKGGDEAEAVPELFQLKFIDNKNYQLEIICRQFPFDPIIVSQRQLPLMVNKVKGGSGLIWGNAESNLGLEILGRKTLVTVKNENMQVVKFKADFGKTPIASCQSYGFTCCQEETSIGIGSQLLETLDCPRSCFDSCQSRPIILSFTSDPFYESKSKTVSIKRSEEIDFSYVIDGGDGNLKAAKISFGDGQEYDFFDTTGSVAHKFVCNKSFCNYEVKITATDMKNVNSADTGVTKIVVKVE